MARTLSTSQPDYSMTAFFLRTRRLVSLSVLLSSAAVFATAQDSRTGVVRCAISDMFGRSVDRVQVSVFDTTGSAVVRPAPETEIRLRFGTYRFKVEAPGFRLEEKLVLVDRESVSVLIGLRLGSFEGTDPRIRVAGRVKAYVGTRTWIRAVPLFSNDSTAGPVDGQGKYDLGFLNAGRYLFVLIVDRQALCFEQHDVTGGAPVPSLARCALR